MTSFIADTAAFVAHQPQTIFALLGTSSPMMNSSVAPVLLSTEETCDLLCSEQPENERTLLKLLSTFSDTMQFAQRLKIHNHRLDKDFIKGVFKNLIENKRYFARTIRHMVLQNAEALVEVFCSSETSSSSHDATTLPQTKGPEQLSNLRSLEIYGFNVLKDAQLQAICLNFPLLENLKIPGMIDSLTDEGFKFLSNLKHLEELDISRAESCETFPFLKDLPKLRVLNLDGCEYVCDMVFIDVPLPSLRELHLLSPSDITYVSLQHLQQNAPHLTSLSCYNVDIPSDLKEPTPRPGYEAISRMECLEKLEMRGCEVMNEKVVEMLMTNLTRLTELTIQLFIYGMMTDECLRLISRTPSPIRKLKFELCTAISNKGLSYLATMPHLESLEFHQSQGTVSLTGELDDEDATVKEAPSKIRSLVFDQGINDAGLKSMFKRFTNLRSLTVNSSPHGITSDGLMKALLLLEEANKATTTKTANTLPFPPPLEELILMGESVSITSFSFLDALPNLKTLNLSGANIDYPAMREASENNNNKNDNNNNNTNTGLGRMPSSLESLTLSRTHITDVDLAMLLLSPTTLMKSLRTLDLSKCVELTDAALTEMISRMKSLERLRLYGMHSANLTSNAHKELMGQLPHLVAYDVDQSDWIVFFEKEKDPDEFERRFGHLIPAG